MPTAENMFVSVRANTLDAACTHTLRKNGADTDLVVSVSATSTGLFEDLVNSDNYVTGDLLDYAFVAGGTTGDIQHNIISCTTDTSDGKVWHMGSAPLGNTLAEGLTRFETIAGELPQKTTEAEAQARIRIALTWSDLGFRVITNTLDVSTEVTSRIDGVDGNQVVSVPSTSTGFFEDTINSDSVSSGEQIAWDVTTKGGSGSIVYTIIQCIIKASPTTQYLMSTANSMTSSGFQTVVNGAGVAASPELEAELTMRVPCIWKKLTTEVFTNTQNLTSTITTRINEADGNQTVSIPANTTGEFEDTTNSDNLTTPGSEIDINETGGSNGSLLMHHQTTIEPSSDAQLMMAAGENTVAFGVTEFCSVMGRLIGSATEANTQEAALYLLIQQFQQSK